MLGLRSAGFSPVAIFVERPRGVGALEVAAFQAAGLPAHEVVDEGVLAHLVFDQRPGA
jgi:hypothetical protein